MRHSFPKCWRVTLTHFCPKKPNTVNLKTINLVRFYQFFHVPLALDLSLCVESSGRLLCPGSAQGQHILSTWPALCSSAHWLLDRSLFCQYTAFVSPFVSNVLGCIRSSLRHVESFVVCGLNSCPRTCAILVPWPQVEPLSPASEGRFLTLGHQGSPLILKQDTRNWMQFFTCGLTGAKGGNAAVVYLAWLLV